VAEVVSQVDDGHATAAELALESVVVGECVAQSLRYSHGELLESGEPPGLERGQVSV
jgi:hypothetical protein